jgi:uncharacterized surface protein with fasciclin (FAS1) repeats
MATALSFSLFNVNAQISPVKRGIGPVIIHHDNKETVTSADQQLQAAIKNKDFSEVTILDALKAIPQLETLALLVEKYDLTDLSNGDVTLIAPTNRAFAEIRTALIRKTSDEIKEILKHHIIAGKKTIAILEPTFILAKDGKFLSGADLKAKAIATDVRTKNGIIHIVDEVILPY